MRNGDLGLTLRNSSDDEDADEEENIRSGDLGQTPGNSSDDEDDAVMSKRPASRRALLFHPAAQIWKYSRVSTLDIRIDHCVIIVSSA